MLRAQNSKKNNYNHAKIARHLTYIEERLSETQQALSQSQPADQVEQLLNTMARHAGRRE